MSMALSFQDFPRRTILLPRVPSRWTILVVSRFCDLGLQIFCQLETPVVEMPTISSISATCPNKWTAMIFLRFRDLRCRDFAYRGFGELSFVRPTPDPRFCDGIRSTAHDLSLSNNPESLVISRFTNSHDNILTFTPCESAK
jgi:hypothetical protein